MTDSNSTKSNKVTPKKYPIVCKFWMKGLCNKDENCAYLHQEVPYNNLIGFNNFAASRTSQLAAKECPHYNLGFCKNGPICPFQHIKKGDESIPEELPIWFIEYVYGRPIHLIFEDFIMNNEEEINQLRYKVLGQFMPFLFYNQIQNFQQQKPLFYKNNFDLGINFKQDYSEQRENIIKLVGQKVRYFFIKCKNFKEFKVFL